MTQRRIDIDERALTHAQRALGTSTPEETINAALRLAGARARQLDDAIAVLAAADLEPQEGAWERG